MDAPLALYRRYRPETFAEMVGQDHVTGPIRQALAGNRVHHAYLFSGPRGCGKTTSARILARALNCEQAPTPEPCGQCGSCRDLARAGPGSLDVIEIDAASHGGVDEARDLRERAFYAPVSSRYKVYIVDEAHMVTTQGFNALLKVVEEPPPHLKFVFATTAPDKVIGTIRSRTHHYPFRLIPPKTMAEYLQQICDREGVRVEDGVVPLVVRAGAGSARDCLGVLDQLIGGAGPDGVDYRLASTLLGYTPESLLDEVIEAFASADAGAVFDVVDRVVESGQDPRRFAEDLLHRLRDLIVVDAVPDAVKRGLIDLPSDQAARLVAQGGKFGSAQLTRAADVISTGLTEMRGATAPRLLLELMCARVLLPAVDDAETGLYARLDRLERRMRIMDAGTDRPSGASPAAVASAARPPAAAPTAADRGTSEPADDPDAVDERAPGAAGSARSTVGLADVRRLWPEILARIADFKKSTWVLVSQHAAVVDARGDVLTLGFLNAPIRRQFSAREDHQEFVRQALIDVLGVDWKVEAVDGGTAPVAAPAGGTAVGAAVGSAPAGPAAVSDDGGDAAPDDPQVEDTAPADLLARTLGATVIEEQANS